MSTSPVNAFDELVLAATEATLGTIPTPANAAAFAAYAVEGIAAEVGPAEVGNTRPKRDRNNGRGPTNGFVEGRVMPMPWAFETSLKSRAAVDTASPLLAFLKACGLVHTINAAANVTITPSGTPIESGDFAGFTMYRFLGSGLACKHGVRMRGCVGKSFTISGAANELLAKFSGVGIGKTTATSQAGVLGKVDSITLASGVVTSLTITAEESKRLGLGYYLCESEVIEVTACTPGGTTATIARGALGTAAAAHTAKPLVPYRPSPTFLGSPIAEATSSITVNSIALEARNWTFEFVTGLDLRQPATGSRYSQGAQYGRYDVKVKAQVLMTGAQVSRMGDVTVRTLTPLVISQGTGVGGIVTINVPYAEIEPFDTPDTENGPAVVDLEFRIRDNGDSGNNAFSIVLT